MKKFIFPFAIACIAVLSMPSCKEPKKVTDDQRHAIEDSIPKLLRHTKVIHTVQTEDYDQLVITVCDPIFYDASPQDRQAMAMRVGAMVVHVLGPDNSITKGTFALTKSTSTDTQEPADIIKADMKIDSLEKLIGGK